VGGAGGRDAANDLQELRFGTTSLHFFTCGCMCVPVVGKCCVCVRERVEEEKGLPRLAKPHPVSFICLAPCLFFVLTLEAPWSRFYEAMLASTYGQSVIWLTFAFFKMRIFLVSVFSVQSSPGACPLLPN
jgi:hypothetical protein